MVRSRATFFARRRLIVKKKCRIFRKRRHPLSGGAERNHGPVASAIARKNSRKHCELKVSHFSTLCGRRKAISRSPLQLRLRRAIRRNSSFLIQGFVIGRVLFHSEQE